MAARGWANSTVTAIGVAAGVGAAQVGLTYGLGIIVWQPVRDATGESLWLTSLAWTLWIAATSTVLGAVFAGRRSTRAGLVKAASRSEAAGNAASRSEAAGNAAAYGGGRRAHAMDLVSRTAIALAAAIGALVTVPLVMLPARAAHRADTFQPQVTAGAYAVVGVIVGLVIAVAAVNIRVIAANVLVSTCWVWILAAVSVADAVRANETVGTAQLAAWQFTDKGWFRETLYLPGALLMFGGALLVGVFATLPADRRADNRVGIAISGTFGPLLVAAAYFLAAPNLTVGAQQLSSYLFAPYAVIAGLAGSVFVSVLGPMRPRGPRAAAATAPVSPLAGEPKPATGAAPKATNEAELTEWTRALGGGSAEPPAVVGWREPAAATAGGDAATVAAPPATGRATVTQPVSPTTQPVSPTRQPASPTITQQAWPTTQPASPTVIQPASPEVPRPRKRRGRGNPGAS